MTVSTGSAFAYGNADGLLFEESYQETMERKALPWIASRRTDETILNGEWSLFTSRFVPEGEARGTVMIVHGFTENADKYAEIIHSLLKNGFCVVAYDQRGHGRSSRKAGITDLSLTHVDRFSDYVDDMALVVDTVLKKMPKPYFLFCHSMGGAVSGLYLASHGDVFERAVFSSPMIAPYLGGAPGGAVKAICSVPIALGRGAQRAFISKPYSGAEDFETSCATSKARFDWYEQLRVKTPAFQNNGPSYTWAREAINVTKKLLAQGVPESIRIPVRVYGAEEDTSVLPQPQKAFAERLPNGSHEVVKGAKHEIYRSPDAVLFPWWHAVLAFYKQ